MLQYTLLSEAFPGYRDTRIWDDVLAPSSVLKRELAGVLDIKDNDKLRVIDGKLCVDKRKNQWFKRTFSRDSRWKVLKVLKKLFETYSMDFDDLAKVVKTLYNTTYNKDKKWKEEMQKIAGSYDLEFDVARLQQRKQFTKTLKVIPERPEIIPEGSSASPPPYEVFSSKK